MKSFLKLVFAAVTAALFVSGSAFAGSVETGSDAKVKVGGNAWAALGYVTGFEDANGDTPTSSFDVSNETRLNVSWGNDMFTGHFEYWMRNDIGRHAGVNDADGDEIMGWVDWMPSPAVQISVGQLEDRSWMERSVDWEIHEGTAYRPGATPGAFLIFPEDQPGIDVSYMAGPIKAGLALYATGVVSGAANDQSTSTASTFIPHVEFSNDMMWIALSFASESVSAAAGPADADGNATWGSTDDTSNTGIVLTTRFNVGVGTAKVQYISRDGDAYEDAQSDIAAAFLFNVGGDQAHIEYDMFDPGGDADAQSWVRLGYTLNLAPSSGLMLLYGMADDGNSSASYPSAAWFTHF